MGSVQLGSNPKINNLALSYAHAVNDWILISDSNVRVKPNYLKNLVAHVSAGTGIVTAVIAGTEASGLGGRLEATYLNSFYARWMRVAAQFRRPCVVGKTMLFRRSMFARFGGIKVLGLYLAEDYMAGEAAQQLGLTVKIASEPVPQHIGEKTFSDFWSRHIRWGRIRKAQAPLAYAIEPLFGTLASGLMGAWAISSLSTLPMLLVFFLHCSFWLGNDWLLHSKLTRQSFYFSDLMAWILRELLAFPLWIHIGIGNHIDWRGQKLRLNRGGIVEAIVEAAR